MRSNLAQNIATKYCAGQSEMHLYFDPRLKSVIKVTFRRLRSECVAEDWMLLEGGVLYGFTRNIRVIYSVL